MLVFGLGIAPLQAALVAFAWSVGLVFLLQLLVTKSTLYAKTSTYDERKQPVYYPIRWLVFGLESLFFRGTIILRTEIPAIVLGYWLGGSEVGLFVVAERAAYLTIFMFSAVRRVFEPMIAPFYEAGDIAQLQLLHARVTRWTFWASVVISAGLFIFSDFLLGLFGAEFIAARVVLWILLLGQVVNAATGQGGFVAPFHWI